MNHSEKRGGEENRKLWKNLQTPQKTQDTQNSEITLDMFPCPTEKSVSIEFSFYFWNS